MNCTCSAWRCTSRRRRCRWRPDGTAHPRLHVVVGEIVGNNRTIPLVAIVVVVKQVQDLRVSHRRRTKHARARPAGFGENAEQRLDHGAKLLQ
jgi:hypothetical protein